MSSVSVFSLIVPAKHILEGGREHPNSRLLTHDQFHHILQNHDKSGTATESLGRLNAPKISWGLRFVHNVFLCLPNYLEAETLTTNGNIFKPNNSERSAALILDWRNLWRLKQQSST